MAMLVKDFRAAVQEKVLAALAANKSGRIELLDLARDIGLRPKDIDIALKSIVKDVQERSEETLEANMRHTNCRCRYETSVPADGGQT